MEINKEVQFNLKDFIYEKKLSINILLEKTIYFPGEEIKGFVFVKGKGTLTNPLFIYSLVKVNIFQIYYYEYDIETKLESDSGEEKLKLKIPFLNKVKEFENQLLYSTTFNFSQYLGSNLIEGIKLPFQIVLPQNLEPTFNFKNSYIRHILTFDFYEFESKNSVGLIIKNRRYFSLENKSLKEPFTIFKDMSKSKFIFFNQGKIAVYITSKSNSYKYGDEIPLDIIVDASELSINLIGIQIKMDRYIQFNKKDDKKTIKEFFTHNLYSQEIKITEKKNNYKYKGEIIPKKDDFCWDPSVFYSLIEPNYLKMNFPDIDILPFCSGGLINCIYLINVKICFDSMATTDETISFPLELYYADNNINNENTIKIHNPYLEIFNEDEINNNNNNSNINLINNNQKINQEDDFEVIEKEDFINALNTKNFNSEKK